MSINIAEATEPLKEIIAAAKARDSFAEANAAPATSAGKLKKTKSVKTAKAVAKQPSAVAKAPKEVEAQNETSTLDAKPPKQVPQ